MTRGRKLDVTAEVISHQRLRRVMEFHRRGVREFAREIGIGNQQLSNMCTGRYTRCSPEVAAKIEAGLRIEPGSLFEIRVPYAPGRARREAIAAEAGASRTGSEDVA